MRMLGHRDNENVGDTDNGDDDCGCSMTGDVANIVPVTGTM